MAPQTHIVSGPLINAPLSFAHSGSIGRHSVTDVTARFDDLSMLMGTTVRTFTMASILIFFFKQGTIFREKQIYGNNFKIVNNRQPLKKIFQFTRYFSSLFTMFSRCCRCRADEF
jgi:hypothetical protein